MYRIMVAKAKKNNYETLYQYLTTTVDGVISPVEIETKTALDTKVENMLNSGEYSKSDFIVVEVIDYTIDANSYTDDEDEKESDNDDESDQQNSEDNGESEEALETVLTGIQELIDTIESSEILSEDEIIS